MGEFEFVSAQTKSGVLARIFACPGPAGPLNMVFRGGSQGELSKGFEDEHEMDGERVEN